MAVNQYPLLLRSRHLLALAAVVDIAASAHSAPVSVPDLGRRYDMRGRLFEPVLQKLVRSGILESQRGKAGGYILGRPAHSITANDILQAVDEGRRLSKRASPPAVNRVETALREALARITVSELASEEAHRILGA
jgi:Rrf2 family protein